MDRRSARVREEKLAHKRNQDYHRQLLWNDVSLYYKTWDLHASKYNGWVSPKNSENGDVFKVTDEKNRKADLGARRRKLSLLLVEENKMFEAEIKQSEQHNWRRRQSNRNSNNNNISDTDGGDTLDSPDTGRERRENKEKNRESDIWSYQQRKSSEPLLVEFKRKQRDRSMKQSWEEQIKEKEIREQTEKELALKLDQETKQLMMSQQQIEERIVEQKHEETTRLRELLMKQMEEMKQKEQHADELQKESDRELALKIRLEQLAVLREETEKKRRNKELSVFLRHQCQSQLKQKTKQIQEELNEDKRLLDQIAECLEQEQLHKKIREQSRKDIDKANALLKEYLELERQREKQLEFIFYEETRKMWQNQENRWKVEQEARNNLMREVLSTIQCQIKENLQANAEKQTQLIEEREKKLKMMEEANRSLQQKELEIKNLQQKWLTDIKEQIKEKEMEHKTIRETEMEEYKKQQLQIAKEEEMILNELKNMNISSNSSSRINFK